MLKKGGKKTPPRETESTLYKTRYPFSHSPPGQGSMSTNLLPIIAPRLEQSYVHTFQLTQKWVGLRSPKGHLWQYLCQRSAWWYPSLGWVLACLACSQTFKSTPASFANTSKPSIMFIVIIHFIFKLLHGHIFPWQKTKSIKVCGLLMWPMALS